MVFIELALSNGRGACVINAEEISAMTSRGDVVEIYLKGETNAHCFEVTETIDVIMKKIRNGFSIEEWV